MLLRLTGEHIADSQPVWVEVQPGGIGGVKGPPSGAVAIGSPGEPGWYYTRVRHDLADNELAKYLPKNGQGFITVELSGRAFKPYRFDTEWFPNPPGLPSPVSMFGKGVNQ